MKGMTIKSFFIPDSKEPSRKAFVVDAVYDRGTLDKLEAVTVRKLGRRDLIARIPHVCDCCKSTIEKGQKYTRIFFLVNGKPSILKYHYTEPVPEDNCR